MQSKASVIKMFYFKRNSFEKHFTNFEVKTFANPPGPVKLTLECICIYLGIKADRKRDENGKMVADYWGPAKKQVLNDVGIFLFSNDNHTVIFISCLK